MDLWPADITVVDVKAPVAVLREQASLLGQKTRNIVQAEVHSIELGVLDYVRTGRGDFGYVFLIVAPALGNYRFQLFEAFHDVGLYPVKIYPDRDVALEILGQEKRKIEAIVADNEKHLTQVLEEIFKAKKTRTVIAALLSQSQAKIA